MLTYDCRLLDAAEVCFISDQQKRLEQSQEEHFPIAGKAPCFRNLEGDALKKGGYAGVRQFKEISYAALPAALDEGKQKASEKIRNWLASKSDTKYTKVYGHKAKRDRMSSSVVEGMNAADSTQSNGTGIRALTPGKMLEAIVFHSAKRADNRRESARNASPTGATPGVVSLLKERKEEAEGKLKFRTATFLSKTRDKAIITHGTPACSRSVNIGFKKKV